MLLSPLLAASDLGWLTELRGIAVALELGLLATAAAYVLFARGLTAVPVAGAATLSLAEPLTGGLLGVLMLGERVGLAVLLGVSLVVGRLALDSVGRKTPPDGRLEEPGPD